MLMATTDGDRRQHGIEDDGFLSLERLRGMRHDQHERLRAALGGAPVLLVQSTTAMGAPAAAPDDLSYRRTLDQPIGPQGWGGRGAGRYARHVGFLLKRPGNPFPSMVSVGRAPNCDLRIALETVSKVQAYFMRSNGVWFLVDQTSRNGTHVNGHLLQSGERRELVGTEVIRFGAELTVALMTFDAAIGRPNR